MSNFLRFISCIIFRFIGTFWSIFREFLEIVRFPCRGHAILCVPWYFIDLSCRSKHRRRTRDFGFYSILRNFSTRENCDTLFYERVFYVCVERVLNHSSHIMLLLTDIICFHFASYRESGRIPDVNLRHVDLYFFLPYDDIFLYILKCIWDIYILFAKIWYYFAICFLRQLEKLNTRSKNSFAWNNGIFDTFMDFFFIAIAFDSYWFFPFLVFLRIYNKHMTNYIFT